jgi:tetratricopeptide (TPR) repeat protein
MEDALAQGLIGIIVAGIVAAWIYGRKYFHLKLHEKRIEKGSINSMYVVAKIYVQKRKFSEAIPLLIKITEKKPNLYEPFELLASCYLIEKKYELAIPLFTRLVKEESNNAQNNFNLGYCYYKTNNTEQALLYQAKAITLNKKLKRKKYIE